MMETAYESKLFERSAGRGGAEIGMHILIDALARLLWNCFRSADRWIFDGFSGPEPTGLKKRKQLSMKKFKQSVLWAVLGFAVCVAGQLQAQTVIPMPLIAKLTIQRQGLSDAPTAGNTNLLKSTIIKVKVTAKDLLNLVAVAYNTTFSNATLVVDDVNGDVLVVDSSGAVLKNATTDGFFENFFNSESNDIFSGTLDNVGFAAAITDIFSNELNFHDNPHNNSFELFGMETFKVSENSQGKFTDSFVLTGAGTGELETPPGGGNGTSLFIINGSVSGKGTGIDQ
jgi:hypothetical protein